MARGGITVDTKGGFPEMNARAADAWAKAMASISYAVDGAAASFARLAEHILDGVRASAQSQDASNSLSKTAVKTAQTVKKANKIFLASFDELNKLPSVEETLESSLSKTGKTADAAEEIVGLEDPMNAVLELAEKVFETVAAALGLLDALFVALLETLGAQNKVLLELASALERVEGLLRRVSQALDSLLASFGQMSSGFLIFSVSQGGGLADFIELLSDMARLALDSAVSALARLWEALAPYTGVLGEGLALLYENVLKPLGSFVFNDVLPRMLQLISAALGALGAVIDAVKPAASFLFENFLKPLAEWTGGVIIDTLEILTGVFAAFAEWIGLHSEEINQALTGIAQVFVSVWDAVSPALDQWWQAFKVFFQAVTEMLLVFADSIMVILGGIGTFLTGVFTSDWTKAWEGVKTIFKGAWSSIVSMLGSAVNLIIKGVNGMISSLNRVSFSVPSWVPSIGGKSFGFKVAAIPEIAVPKLAAGAVIPANREFLAVLGDQRSGRNLEAPESLIRQIVREESGGTGGETDRILGEILAAVRAGQVITVNEAVLGRVTANAQNAEMRRLGFTPLTV